MPAMHSASQSHPRNTLGPRDAQLNFLEREPSAQNKAAIRKYAEFEDAVSAIVNDECQERRKREGPFDWLWR